MTLSPEQKRLRRRERLRLIAYLMKGGRLLREDMPAGAVAWVRQTRSGHPFSDRAVSRMVKRGYAVVRGETYPVVEGPDGSVLFADFQ